jgi:hypothetical protein
MNDCRGACRQYYLRHAIYCDSSNSVSAKGSEFDPICEPIVHSYVHMIRTDSIDHGLLQARAPIPDLGLNRGNISRVRIQRSDVDPLRPYGDLLADCESFLCEHAANSSDDRHFLHSSLLPM